MKHNKKFVIIGSKNTITYKEIFPLIKDNKLWVGTTSFSKDILFIAPKNANLDDKPKTAIRVVDGVTYLRSPSVWFTNLDHGRRHQPLQLMTMADNLKHNKKLRGKTEYDKYDNYEAIEVPFTDAIPSDYDGAMGVPISFLDKYSPEQFEIIAITKTWYDFANKTYPPQTQISKIGIESRVTKLNDGATVALEEPPIGKTYYVVDGKYYEQMYARIIIKHRKATK